jgi:hypothetical protein
MAVGFPAKTDFATGDVLTATNVNDITGTLNLLQSSLFTAGQNKIINGAFNVWQRGTTFDITTSTFVFNADRFFTGNVGNTGTVSQQTFTPGAAPVAGYESQYFARANIVGVAGASNEATLQQRIEDVRTFAGQTVTVSFWAKADAAKNVSLELQQNFGSGGSANVNTFIVKQALTTSWARYTATFAIPSVSGKTIGTSSFDQLRFWLSAGSSLDARTGTLGTQSIIFDVWGVQLEYGSTASPFQTASGSIAGELALCQRYYYRIIATNAYGQMGMGSAYSTTAARIQVQAPVYMRTSPTSVDFSTLILYDGVTTYTCTTCAIDTSQTSPKVQSLIPEVASGLTQYRPYILMANNSTSAYIGFSAEL